MLIIRAGRRRRAFDNRRAGFTRVCLLIHLGSQERWPVDIRQLDAWGAGIDYEIAFWDSIFATKGLQWPDDYAAYGELQVALDAANAKLAELEAPGRRS